MVLLKPIAALHVRRHVRTSRAVWASMLALALLAKCAKTKQAASVSGLVTTPTSLLLQRAAMVIILAIMLSNLVALLILVRVIRLVPMLDYIRERPETFKTRATINMPVRQLHIMELLETSHRHVTITALAI